MKQYVIDELRPLDYQKLKDYLEKNFESSAVGEIYWIPIEQEILTDVQIRHKKCQPFYFAAALEERSIAFELLVRTKNRIRCECISYATEKQRNWLIKLADAMCEKLEILT